MAVPHINIFSGWLAVQPGFVVLIRPVVSAVARAGLVVPAPVVAAQGWA